MLVTMLGQSREHVYWLKYQCRDIISWIGGGPRSTVGIAMEEEGVVVEVAHCVCVCLSGLACSYVSTYISYRSYGITILSTPEVCYHMYVWDELTCWG